MKWNVKSKRYTVVGFVNIMWLITLTVSHELFRFLTPWVMGFNGGYVISETWRPSGLDGTDSA